MANFVYIENNEIKEKVDILPNNWKNISGLHLAENNDIFLNSHGWFRVTKKEISFDSEKEEIVSYKYTIKKDKIIETPVISKKVVHEFADKKINFLNQLRELRNRKLRLSDWTQLNDVDLPNKQQWIEYRQKLRNIVKEYENTDVVDIELVNWPEQPS